MNTSTIDQVKDRIDIVDLIQGYLRLQKAGMNYKALCPFHNEKTPSFMVSPDRQIWHCFGCGKGSDIFGFVKEIEGIEFPEALRILAKKAGVEIKGFDKEFVGERPKLYEICELAAKFFEKQLWQSDNGKKALEYLRGRGLKDETIKEWRLGFAPNTWNSLKVFLKNAGYIEQQIFNAGLTVKKDSENIKYQASDTSYDSYDRFRGRIMFPIADINSQIVGFTGRVFEPVTGEVEAGKYVNTPQTTIYDKSRILYGLDKAKMDVRKSDRAIIVEGNMDAITSHQAGVKNVVASSGTALTGQHLKILKRYTSNLNLCFDQDLAGEAAAKRGIDLALAMGFNVGLINISAPTRNAVGAPTSDVGAKDPADLVKENPQAWAAASQKSQPIISFYIEKAFQKHDLKTALGKKNIALEVLPVIKLVENKVEQAHWLDEFANKLGIDQKILVQAMAQIKNQSSFGKATEDKQENKDFVSLEKPPRLIIEETLLALLLRMPEKAKEINKDEFEIFNDALYNNIFERLKAGEALFDGSLPYEDSLRVELIKFKSEQFFGDLEEKDLESEISRMIKSLKKELILEKIKDLEIKIRQAKNVGELPILLREVQRFSNKLASL